MLRVNRLVCPYVLALAATACQAGKVSDQGTSKPAAKQAVSRTEDETGSRPERPNRLEPAGATTRAPQQFAVELTTGKGEILIDVQRDWAPRGADRFYNLVRIGYYDDNAFFRVVEGFMAQVGINGDPRINRIWRLRRIADDPVKQSNTRGMVSFATSGKDSRTTQFFINFGDNSRLDGMGFAPFGKVRDMKPVDALYAGYGEGAPRGSGPLQRRIQMEGNAYLKAEFPELDYIQTARVVE